MSRDRNEEQSHSIKTDNCSFCTRSPFVPRLPDLLVAVGETSFGIWTGLIGSAHSLRYLFTYLIVFEM